MTALLALIRRQVREALWLVLLLGGVLFAFSMFAVTLVVQVQQELSKMDVGAMLQAFAQRPPGPPAADASKDAPAENKDAQAETKDGRPRRPRGLLGLFRGLGGSAMDFSPIALEVTWFNHPLVLLTFIGLGVARGSSAVSSEIERGTLDITLSRPVSRSTFLLAHVLSFLIVLAALVGLFVAGYAVGNLVFKVENPPSIFKFGVPATLLIGLSASIYGLTVPFSAWDINRWRPAFIGLAIVVGGMIAYLYSLDENYRDLEKLSVLRAYTPVTCAVKGDDFAFNAGILGLVFAVGVALAFVIFNRRDLPANA
jgi:ABC-2 type transport system permease protein